MLVKSRGFTLVELLVSLAVVAILVVAMVAYLNPIQQFNKAKDAQKRSDLDHIKKALELYYNDKGYYPLDTNFNALFGAAFTDTCPTSNPNCSQKNTVYMQQVPQDPTCNKSGGSCYSYISQHCAAGVTNCRPQWYALYAKLAASSVAANTCPIAPDPTCTPSDYVAGKFACSFAGSISCGTLASGGGGSSTRCRSYYTDTDRDGHFSKTPQQVCADGFLPPLPPGAQATPGDDCDDNDPNAYVTKICYRDADADTYTVNTATTYCGSATDPNYSSVNSPKPANCYDTPSSHIDCDDTDATRTYTRSVYTINPPDCSASPSTTICSVPAPTPIPASHLGTAYSTSSSGHNLTCTNNNTSGTFSNTCVVPSSSTCPTGYYASCASGYSACPGPTPSVGSACKNLQTDSNNCGACGNVCAGGGSCRSGVCAFPKRVFLTSNSYNGNLGGLSGADTKCQTSADARQLGGTWKAWLSDYTTSAKDRQSKTGGPYKTVTNVVIADDFAGLTSASLKSPINVTESGSTINTFTLVWTQTNNDGTKNTNGIWYSTGTFGASYPHVACENWTTNSPRPYVGGVGSSGSANEWSNSSALYDGCNVSWRLYCFEQ